MAILPSATPLIGNAADSPLVAGSQRPLVSASGRFGTSAGRVYNPDMHDSRPARLIDVAKLAGVGKTTASDALSGTGRVSEATRKAVLAVADQLGYVPNTAAQYLRKAATGTIAVILPEVLSRSTYYMAFVFGIVSRAADFDYDVTIVNPSEEQRRNRMIRADGLIMGDPRRDDPVLSVLLNYPVPVVTIERPLGPEAPAGVIWSAHRAGMTQLLAELDGTGFRHPAMIVGVDDTEWTTELSAGFRDGCRDRGLEPVTAGVPFEAAPDQVRAATELLLREHPDIDAIVCAPDSSAIEVSAVLRRQGREPGTDVAVVSCVDSQALQFMSPSVTAIDLRPRAAGIAAADLLLDLMAGRAEAGTEREHPIEVIPRTSTARVLSGAAPRG